jgi:Fe-S-cluster containining protein
MHVKPDPDRFDCVRCGACCCNIDKNRALGFRDYVEVEPRDKLRKEKRLLPVYVVFNEKNEPHMKLRNHRCVALKGRIGVKVGCEIYPLRPSGCRRVQPGDAECRRARRERGIDPALRPRGKKGDESRPRASR